MAETEDDVPSVLLPCSICSRTFKPESLQKHFKTCEKIANKKRKIFDSSKQRIQGTELAVFLPVILHTKKTEKTIVKKTQSKWKEKHLEFVRAIRAARGVEEGPNRKTSAAALLRPSNHERCPHCDRQFGPKAFDRHIEWCREQKARIPKSPASLLAKERLEARTKYRAPPLAKSKRSLTREKYASPSHHTSQELCPPAIRSPQQQLQTTTTMSSIKGVKSQGGRNSTKVSVSSPACGLQRTTSQRSSIRQRSASPTKRVSCSSKTAPGKPKPMKKKDRVSENNEDMFSTSYNITKIQPSAQSRAVKGTKPVDQQNKPSVPMTSQTLMRSNRIKIGPLPVTTQAKLVQPGCQDQKSCHEGDSLDETSVFQGNREAPYKLLSKVNSNRKLQMKLNDIYVNKENIEMTVSAYSILPSPPARRNVTKDKERSVPSLEVDKSKYYPKELNKTFTVAMLNSHIDVEQKEYNLIKDTVSPRSEHVYHDSLRSPVKSTRCDYISPSYEQASLDLRKDGMIMSPIKLTRDDCISPSYKNVSLDLRKHGMVMSSVKSTRGCISPPYEDVPIDLRKHVMVLSTKKSTQDDCISPSHEDVSLDLRKHDMVMSAGKLTRDDCISPSYEQVSLDLRKHGMVTNPVKSTQNYCISPPNEDATLILNHGVVMSAGKSTQDDCISPSYEQVSLDLRKHDMVTSPVKSTQNYCISPPYEDATLILKHGVVISAGKSTQDYCNSSSYNEASPDLRKHGMVTSPVKSTRDDCISPSYEDVSLDLTRQDIIGSPEKSTQDDLRKHCLVMSPTEYNSSNQLKLPSTNKDALELTNNNDVIWSLAAQQFIQLMLDKSRNTSTPIKHRPSSEEQCNYIDEECCVPNNLCLASNQQVQNVSDVWINNSNQENSEQQHISEFVSEHSMSLKTNYKCKKQRLFRKNSRKCNLGEKGKISVRWKGRPQQDVWFNSDEGKNGSDSSSAEVLYFNNGIRCSEEHRDDDFSAAQSPEGLNTDSSEEASIISENSGSVGAMWASNDITRDSLEGEVDELEEDKIMDKTCTAEDHATNSNKPSDVSDLENLSRYKNSNPRDMDPMLNSSSKRSLTRHQSQEMYFDEKSSEPDLIIDCSILPTNSQNTDFSVNSMDKTISQTSGLKADMNVDISNLKLQRPFTDDDDDTECMSNTDMSIDYTVNAQSHPHRRNHKTGSQSKSFKATIDMELNKSGSRQSICSDGKIRRDCKLQMKNQEITVDNFPSKCTEHEVLKLRSTKRYFLRRSVTHSDKYTYLSSVSEPTIIGGGYDKHSQNGRGVSLSFLSKGDHDSKKLILPEITKNALERREESLSRQQKEPKLSDLAEMWTSKENAMKSSNLRMNSHQLNADTQYSNRKLPNHRKLTKAHWLPPLKGLPMEVSSEFSSSDDSYDPYASAERQMLELLSHGDCRPEPRHATRPILRSAPAASCLETSPQSAFARYTQPEDLTSSLIQDLEDLIISGHSTSNLSLCENNNNSGEVPNVLSSFGFSFVNNNIDNGERIRKPSKIRAKMESASLSLQQSVSLLNYENDQVKMGAETDCNFLHISDDKDNFPSPFYAKSLSFPLSSPDSKHTLPYPTGPAEEGDGAGMKHVDTTMAVEDEELSPVSNRRSAASKLSADSAYSSLNRRSPHQADAVEPAALLDSERCHLLSSSSSESSLPPLCTVQVVRCETKSQSLTPTPPSTMQASPVQQMMPKMPKFCHECGSKYPVSLAKFCCQCGARRLVI